MIEIRQKWLGANSRFGICDLDVRANAPDINCIHSMKISGLKPFLKLILIAKKI
jgi:hypothetical protein